MALFIRNELLNVALFLGLALFLYKAEGLRPQRGLATLAAPAGPAAPAAATTAAPDATAASATAAGVFDVTKYGAKGDGKLTLNEDGDPVNSFAFIQAWVAACKSTTPAKVLIPPGKFVVGQVLFGGPCKNRPVVEVQGTVVASTDLSGYPSPEWIMFEKVDGVTLTGTGTFDGQGQVNWAKNDCGYNGGCANLPTSIKFHRANNSVIEGIKSVNSMFFHIFITGCHNVTIHNVQLTAPFDSPNTDGIHTSLSEQVTITNSVIGTGDDCVSVGQGSVNVTVAGVRCGPGHGISVGSLGKIPGEKPVKFVHVKNCSLTKTTNGARIKSFAGKNIPSAASDIVYEDLVLDQVNNPILIDQHYGSKKKNGQESKVKISNVQFKNIRGTASTNQVVNILCSQTLPCEGIQVNDIDIKPMPLKGGPQIASACLNAKVVFGGKHDGLSCGGAPEAATAEAETAAAETAEVAIAAAETAAAAAA